MILDKQFIISTFEYFKLLNHSYAVKLVSLFLLSLFVGIVLLSLFTLLILALHKVSLYFEKRYSQKFNNLCINYMLDQSSEFPHGGYFTKKYLRNAILDLLFVTKGFERTILLDIYKKNGFWDADHKRLSSWRWHKRLGALVRLDQWQICLGYDLFVKLSQDSNVQIRQIAVKNLSRTNDKVEAKYLIDILNRQKFFHSTIYESIHRLIRHHPDAILEALQDKDSITLLPFILRAIGNTTMIEATPFVVKIANEHESHDAREMAIVALGKIGDPRGIDVLKTALLSANAKERLGGLQGLYKIDVMQIKPYINVLLNDTDPIVKNWMNYYLRLSDV